ncbi:MAG: cytosine permease [Tissierellia bacterium]|nr:cytosine permease [Tissierellia bacterium]
MAENTMKISKTADLEYTQQAVPKEERQSFFQVSSVILGYEFIVTSIQVGSTMGQMADLKTILLAILAGSAFLMVLGGFIAFIASRNGITFGQLSEFSFGEKGSKFISTLIALSLVGWFSVDIYLVGQATNALFPSVPIIPVVIIAGVLMTFTAIFGMKLMSKLGSVSVPLILIFGVYSMIRAISDFGGFDNLFAANVGQTVSFVSLVSLAIGSWVASAVTLLPDIIRYAKNEKQALIIAAIAILFGNALMMIIGAIGTITTGQGELSYVLAAQGLIAPAWLIMVVNNWSAAQGCAYSGALTMGSVTGKPHKPLTIAIGAIGILMAAFGFYDSFGSFIIFLSSTVPVL